VVATEVKSLAEESENSAEKIRQMIGELQKQTQRAVENVEKSTGEVKEGGIALSQTLEVFNKIVASIDEINRNINDVAASAEEQAASVEEVTASVNEVNGLVSDTAKEATDSAAASEESSAAIDQITKIVQNVTIIADQVQKEVGKFKVRAGAEDTSSDNDYATDADEDSPAPLRRIAKSGSSNTARAA
jgi:methyl-accepting chemotaxis protein